MKKRILFGLALGLMLPVMANALPVMDQVSNYSNTIFNADNTNITWQQEVMVGLSGHLTAIDLYAATPGKFNFYVNTGNGWQADANDFSLNGYNLQNQGWNSIDLSDANLHYNAGDTFVIGIQGIFDSTWVGGSSLPGLYPAGHLYLNDSSNLYWDYAIAFRTYMDPISGAPLPASATVLLLGSLVSLAGTKLRRKKN